MKIGVALRCEGFSTLFSNGMSQNVHTYVVMLSKMGHEVTLLCPNNNKWTKEAQRAFLADDLLRSLGVRLGEVDTDHKCDLYLHAASMLSIAAIILYNPNAAHVGLNFGHSHAIMSNIILNKPGQNSTTVPSGWGYDEVWISPHYARFAHLIAKLNGCPCRIMPYVWTPIHVDRSAQTRGKTPSYCPHTPKSLYCLEPNRCPQKTSLIPIAIADEVFSQATPDFPMFKRMNVMCADKFVKSKSFLRAYSKRNHRLVYSDKFCAWTEPSRVPAVDLYDSPGCVVVSHHDDNSLNYVALECLHFGIPLVHNSEEMKEVGYYYPDFDVQKGAEALRRVLMHHDTEENRRDYAIRAEPVLWRYSDKNPTNIDALRKLVESVQVQDCVTTAEQAWEKLGLFWQYPVITEKTFYLQNAGDNNYLPFPWAEVIDRRKDIKRVLRILSHVFVKPGRSYYTCCQHINFRSLKGLWEELGVHTVYTPHKCIGEETLGTIRLVACPLYAVNLEDSDRNSLFENVDLQHKERKYLYSFSGGYQKDYLTETRLRIFELPKRPDCMVRNTGDWHFNVDVYGGKADKKGTLNEDATHRNKTEGYNQLLLDSQYTLAPGGNGPSSIRFWEALGAGSIPVLLSDTMDLPHHEFWDDAVVRVAERDVARITDVLMAIGKAEQARRRGNCLRLYHHFRGNFRNRVTQSPTVTKGDGTINVIIPYRDRGAHLNTFLDEFVPVLRTHIPNLQVTIVEQSKDGQPFNRGKLLNAGVRETCGPDVSHVVFHDVDTIASGSCVERLYGHRSSYKQDIVRIYVGHNRSLGGICKIAVDALWQMNGHPNWIWGWGIEDRALYYRAQIQGIEMSPANLTKPGELRLLSHPRDPQRMEYKGDKRRISEQWKQGNIERLSAAQRQKLLDTDGLDVVSYTVLNSSTDRTGVTHLLVQI